MKKIIGIIYKWLYKASGERTEPQDNDTVKKVQELENRVWVLRKALKMACDHVNSKIETKNVSLMRYFYDNAVRQCKKEIKYGVRLQKSESKS